MSQSKIVTVNFGLSKAGLSTVGYTLKNYDGTTKQNRSTSGVTEIVASTGIYSASISFDDDWTGIVVWDTGEASPRYATETYNINDLGGGGYAVIASDVWTQKEKEDLIDKVNKIYEGQKKKTKSMQEALEESNRKIADVNNAVSLLNEVIRGKDAKFQDIKECVSKLDKQFSGAIEALNKSSLLSNVKLTKEVKDKFEALKETVSSVKNSVDTQGIIKLVGLLSESVNNISDEIDLTVRIATKLITTEDLEQVLKEGGINVPSGINKRA
ncbi:MAG: hypothetical protein HY761_09990 [Candidatus Omnitrophica bacterium]|nr:hypothetical protein [Candidatus Omnitrophota bacterium]